MDDPKSRDLELWRQWKRTQSQADLEALMKQLWPVVRRETQRWAAIVAPSLLDNEAKIQAIKAFQTYDPNRDTALSTHLTYQLRKLSRTAYAQQSTLGVPEQKRLLFNNYNRAYRQLEDLTGRPPSLDDVADHMRLPPAKLREVIAVVGKKEFMESGDGPAFVQHMDDPEVVHLAYYDMTPVQKTIFGMRTGYGGNAVKSGTSIMHATGLSQGQLSYQIGQMKTLLERAQRLR